MARQGNGSVTLPPPPRGVPPCSHTQTSRSSSSSSKRKPKTEMTSTMSPQRVVEAPVGLPADAGEHQSHQESYSLRLLPAEKSDGFGKVPSINSITIHQGIPDAEKLRERVSLIVEKNPWLASRITWGYEGYQADIQFPLRDCFYEAEVPSHLLQDSLAHYPELVESLEKWMIGRNTNLARTGGRLFQVVLLRGARADKEEAEEERCAIFISMSHILGDGATYYKIYEMLTGEARPLQADRAHTIWENYLKARHEVQEDWFWEMETSEQIFTYLDNAPPCTASILAIDSQWIREEKAKYAGWDEEGAPMYVSSNDIITSEFFNAARFNRAVGYYNVRGRSGHATGDITPDHAGNYIEAVLYAREDWETPDRVRASIKPMLRSRTAGKPFPERTTEKSWELTFITNWTSLYSGDQKLDGCTHVMHLAIWTASSMPYGDGITLFNIREGEMAAVVCSRGADPRRFAGVGPLRPMQQKK
jgi:hypothetical protein